MIVEYYVKVPTKGIGTYGLARCPFNPGLVLHLSTCCRSVIFIFFREKARGENYAEKISIEIGNLAATKDRAYSVKSYLERFAYIEQGESRKK